MDVYVCRYRRCSSERHGATASKSFHDGIRESFQPSSGGVFYHFSFVVVNRPERVGPFVDRGRVI